MMDILWTNQMSVGNRIIDSEHKELLGMANRIGHMVRVKNCSAISEEFKLLENRLCAYSLVEENIAQVVKFPFTQHKLAHQSLLNQIQCTRDDLAAMNGIWSDGEVEMRCYFLGNCLVQHFKEESAQMKVVLDTHFYDLKPG